MKVQVLFFAQLRDLFGTHQRELELREGTTAGEVVEYLINEFNARSLRELPLLYSINDEFAKESEALHDRDILGLLPPVAGG